MRYTLDDFWKVFGDKRFTKVDLWGAFGHQAHPGFPTAEWLTRIGIGKVPWLETDPGPRGGDGYRINANAIRLMQAKDAKRRDREVRLLVICEAVKVPFGRLYVEAGKLKWTYYPNSGLGIRLSSGIAMTWNEKVSAAKVQEDVNWKVSHVAKLARESVLRKRSEIEQLDVLLFEIASTTKSSC